MRDFSYSSPISALLRRLSPSRSCCDMFREEPAFPTSIGLSPLDTGHASDLHINTSNGPPRSFRHASTCPRLDHPVSGRIRTTPRTFIRRPSLLRATDLSLSLRLPPLNINLPPIYTPWPVLQNVRQNTGDDARTTASRVFLRIEDPFMPCRTVTTQFQALCTSLYGVLFSFRSPYYCTIGLKLYLVLEVGDPQIPARFPTHGTQDTTPAD